jgi:hypothetical protein
MRGVAMSPIRAAFKLLGGLGLLAVGPALILIVGFHALFFIPLHTRR